MTWLGYSEGSLRANDATFTSGGQCEDGVKMIIAIEEIEVPTSDGKKKIIKSVITCIITTIMQLFLPIHTMSHKKL